MLKYNGKAIGLISGGGNLPAMVVEHCLTNKIDVFVACIADVVPENLNEVPHEIMNITEVGRIFNFFRTNNIDQLVLIGKIGRPKLPKFTADLEAAKLLAQISKAKLTGDDSLLSIVVKFIEKSGFKIVGIDQILSNILTPKKNMTSLKPAKSDKKNINLGMEAAKIIGDLDIGQSVVVQQGNIIAVEGIEGTDELIKRSGKIKMPGPPPILVKAKKPHQDQRIDLPTIGKLTVQNAIDAGFAGIAAEAGASLMVDKDEMIALANNGKIFISGI